MNTPTFLVRKQNCEKKRRVLFFNFLSFFNYNFIHLTMALQAPRGAYGYDPRDDEKKQDTQEEHNGLVSYKMLDSTNISHREIQLLREQIWRMRHPNAQEREQLWPSNVIPKVTDLKGIATQRLFQWESDTTWFRAYEVELHQFTGFQYVLDFTGTTNHEIQGTFGVQNGKVEANLQPFELETICLISRNKLDPFKFSVKMSYVTTDVHPAILQTALAMNEHRYIYNEIPYIIILI